MARRLTAFGCCILCIGLAICSRLRYIGKPMSRATLPIPHEKTSRIILLYSISLPPELPLGMISLDTTDLPAHYLTQHHLHSVAPRIFKICLLSILEPSISSPPSQFRHLIFEVSAPKNATILLTLCTVHKALSTRAHQDDNNLACNTFAFAAGRSKSSTSVQYLRSHPNQDIALRTF